MEQKDNKNNSIGQRHFNDLSLNSLYLFKNKPFYIYLYKKNQKLVSAFYMLTDLFENREALKWNIREKSLKLISSCMSLITYQSDLSLISKNTAVTSLTSTLLELNALCELAHISKLISDMNFEVIKNEIQHLIEILEEREKASLQSTTIVLTEEMFKTDEEKILPGKQYEKLLHETPANPSKSQPSQNSNFFYRGQKKDIPFMKPNDAQSSPLKLDTQQSQEKKTNRREQILALLQGGKELTIKDFSETITDCSEKTIQRELLVLVSSGILKKIGERRWSKYSLY